MISDSEREERKQELNLLGESVKTLLSRAGGVDRARNARNSRDGVNRNIWSELAEAGILGVMAGENAGGLGLGLTAGGVIAEEIGRALAPEPFAPVTGLAAGLIERLTPKNTLLAAIIAGESIPAVAWQERASSGPSNTLETQLTDGTLSGTKSWVANAEGADVLLVIAGSSDGQVLCQVETSADGVTLEATPQADGSYLYEVTFAKVASKVIAKGPQVSEALAASIDDATALAAAEMLGVISEALKITLEFLGTREQFGKPIGVFQALQHRAVDMFIGYEIAAAGIREALTLMDETSDAQQRSSQASRAKARAGEAAQKITRDAIQMHGAVGYTDEFDVGLYLNRALVLAAWLGDATYHRRNWFKLNNEQG